FSQAVLQLMGRRRGLPGGRGRLEASHTSILRKLGRDQTSALEPSLSKSEPTSSAVLFGDRLMLRFFRRLEVGVDPELEIGRFLLDRRFPHTWPLAGALEYLTAEKETLTLAVLSAAVPNCRTAWEYTLDTLSRFYERVQTASGQERPSPLPQASLIK